MSMTRQNPAQWIAPWPGRGGFTLIELVLSSAIGAILLLSTASAVMLAARALPSRDRPVNPGAATLLAADRIASELAMAKRITEATTTSVTFVVADRTGDSADDTISYSWTGTAGDPILRRVNGGAAVSLIPAADALAIDYNWQEVTTTTTTTVEVTSGEVTIDGFTGFSSVTAPVLSLPISATNRAAVSFRWTPPRNDVTRLEITRAAFRLARGTSSGSVIATAHQSTPAQAGLPGTQVGDESTVLSSSIAVAPGWVEFTFTGAEFAGPAFPEIVFALRGVGADVAGLTFFTSSTSPLTTPELRWSTNSGALWRPVEGSTRHAAPFVVTGRYTYPTTTVVSSSVQQLRSAVVRIAASGAPGGMESAATAYNLPELRP